MNEDGFNFLVYNYIEVLIMANATVSRLGQVNGTGSATDLFLKVFSGEVLTSFHRNNVFLEKSMVRSISSGE